MRCTNYSHPTYKLLQASFGRAATDYLAAIVETDSFKQWYGSDKLPDFMQGDTITNADGDKWNFMVSLENWKQAEERALGIREGEDRLYADQDTPNSYEKLEAKASAYNEKDGPFSAHIGRHDKGYYLYLNFNQNYKSKAVVKAEAPAKQEAQSLFYFHDLDTTQLDKGKNISIRTEFCREGVYRVGDQFYRVSLKYDRPVLLKDTTEKSKLRDKLVQDGNTVEAKATRDFFAGRAPMFIYEINKIAENEATAKALPDFVGVMSIKPTKKARSAKFLTGYTDIDKYMKVLAEHKESLYRQKAAVRTDLKAIQDLDSRIDIITQQMDMLYKEKDIDSINDVGRRILGMLLKELDEAQSFERINEALRLAKAWKELDKVLEFHPTDPDEEEQAILDEAKEVRSLAQTLFQGYFNKFRNKMLDMVDERLGPDQKGKLRSLNLVDDNGELRILDVDKWGAMSIGMSFSANEIEQLTSLLIEEAEMKALDEDYDFNKRLENAISDLLGKSYKSSKASDFNFMFSKDAYGKSAIVTKRNKDFYKQMYTLAYKAFDSGKMNRNRSSNYQAAIALGATAEDLKGKVTDKAYYEFEREHFDYVLTDEGRAEFEKYMEAQKQALITGYDEDSNPIYDEKKLEKIRKEYDPEVYAKYLSKEAKVYNKGHRWFTKTLKENVAYSKEYAAMNEKQRKFYEFFTHEFIEGQQDMVLDYRFTDVQLDRHLLDFVLDTGATAKDKAKFMGKQLRSFMEGIAGVRYYEDENVKVPSRALTGVEHIGIEFKKIGEFIPDGAAMTKGNPVEILKNFRLAGHMFKYKRQIEDSLNAIRDLTLSAAKAERTADGRMKRDIVGKIFTSTHKTNIADRVEYNAKVALTGERKEPYTVKPGGKPGQLKFSGEKAIDSINNYTRFKAMALSPLSATGNFVMGAVNNWIYSASSEFYSDKELGHAYWLMKASVSRYYSKNYVGDKNAKKIAEILMRYNVIGDVTEKLYHGSDFLSWFFTLQQSGEFINQGATTVAQMLREKVELSDGKKVSLWEFMNLDKNGKLEMDMDKLPEDSKWRDPATLHTFFRKVRKVNQKIHGDYHNPLLIKKDVVGRVFMLFRTWLPMAIKERFGAQYEDELLGTQKGRFISAKDLTGKAIKGAMKGDWSGAGDFAKVLARIFLPILGRKLKFSKKLSEVDKRNLEMFAREMQFIGMLTLVCLSLKAAVDDDDDEDGENLLRYLYNQMERTQSELQFFFSPKDEMQILRDIIPMYTTFRDIYRVGSRTTTLITEGEEADTYQRGFRKGHSKTWTAAQEALPVLRSIQKTWSSSEQIFSDTRFQ